MPSWGGHDVGSLPEPGLLMVGSCWTGKRTSNVCFTPNSGRKWAWCWRSVVDPEETLALPKGVENWSLTTLREKLAKIGAKVVRHGRYVTFQLAEVAVSRDLFRKILSLIDDLRPRPAPA